MSPSTQPTSAYHLYNDLAWVWPLLSPPETYQEEARRVHQVIARRLGEANPSHPSSPLPQLLELGSGGGHLLHYLQQWYQPLAVDCAKPMLNLSKKLNPQVVHKQGDMKTVRLHKTFDVVVIHDALGYLLTPQELLATFTTANMHLRSGGVLVLLPDELEETFEDRGHATDQAVAEDGTQVQLTSKVRQVKNTPAYELTMRFEISPPNGQALTITDRHRCGLFPARIWRQILTQAGFKKTTLRKQVPWRQGPLLVAQK